MRSIIIGLLLIVTAGGCTRVVVHKNPKPRDVGIRYYRPKPYLFISPGAPRTAASTQSISLPKPIELKMAMELDSSGTDLVRHCNFQPGDTGAITGRNGAPKAPDGAAGTDKEGVKEKTDNRPGAISIELVWLPDFAEEYSIQLKPGMGVGELNVQLQNGWNLTSVGIKTDQQTDEIINSVANLVDKAGSFGDVPQRAGQPIAAVYATNVPFGFYEAVIAEDPCGRKQLYGWRYIGFMPFQTCPTTACGLQGVDCNNSFDAIYGLVWIDGILQFAHLTDIPHDPIARVAAPTTAVPTPTPVPPTPSVPPSTSTADREASWLPILR